MVWLFRKLNKHKMVKVKVKMSTSRPRKRIGGVSVQLHSFLTLELHGNCSLSNYIYNEMILRLEIYFGTIGISQLIIWSEKSVT
jgi:hypothetical protein